MARSMGRLAGACVALGLLCAAILPAHADIKAFNAAVTAGDFKAASAAAAETWPALDKAAPDIAVTAREFAWVSMLAGDPARAQAYTGFLVARASALGPGDPSQVTWRVLDAWAAFAVRPARETRKALADALAARAAIPGKDLISLRAAQALFKDEWDGGRWSEAAAAGDLGAHIAKDFGQAYLDVAYHLEMGSIAATFADRVAADPALRMKELAKRAYVDALSTTSEKLKERLTIAFFTIDAWAEVTNLVLVQDGKKGIPPDKPDTTISSRLTPAPGDPALPECQIVRAASTKQPKYPTGLSFRGWPGFATYRLKVAQDGRFTEIKLMGAAPNSDFASATDKVINDWRWQFAGTARPPACRMPVYYYLAFQFGAGS